MGTESLPPALGEQNCKHRVTPEERKGWGGRECRCGIEKVVSSLVPCHCASGKGISQLIRLMLNREEMGLSSLLEPGCCLMSEFLPKGDQKREKMVGIE